jgi:hypothetical protein
VPPEVNYRCYKRTTGEIELSYDLVGEPGRGRACHLDAPYHTSFVFVRKKYDTGV